MMTLSEAKASRTCSCGSDKPVGELTCINCWKAAPNNLRMQVTHPQKANKFTRTRDVRRAAERQLVEFSWGKRPF